MAFQLTVFFLVLLTAAHGIGAASMATSQPKKQPKDISNAGRIARECVPLADALARCYSLLETSKDWKDFPYSHLAMARSYFVAIVQLVDQLLETIDTMVPRMDYKMRQALNIDRFLFEIARMAYLLVRGIYYAPVEAMIHSDDAPSESIAKQLHAYFYYVTHIACVSFEPDRILGETFATFNGKRLFSQGDIQRIKRMIGLISAYVGQDHEYAPSEAHYMKCAGIYAKAFSMGDPHPDAGRFTRESAREHYIKEATTKEDVMLRKACVCMGGPTQVVERRFHGVQESMFIVKNLFDLYG